MISVDRNIINSSDAIDLALSHMTKDNRGEFARNILSSVRTLNDNIAAKIWMEIEPTLPMSINKVASKFSNKREYQFIYRFDSFLRKSLSHFLPTIDGAERLMLKYFQYILQLKKIMKQNYMIDIIKNIDMFLLDTDEQTRDYYSKVASELERVANRNVASAFDNYYISRSKPFFVGLYTYYEVTLEPAEEKPNKFNRITAFTKHEMMTNYSVALRFVRGSIDIFRVDFPIVVITEWKVSIRPCEFNNFAKILNLKLSINRGLSEYKAFMDFLTVEQLSLIEIIDLDSKLYKSIKDTVVEITQDKHSKIFDILDKCRLISLNNSSGINIIRYLLNSLNNRVIKLQWPNSFENSWADFYLSTKCYPFDNMPFYFNPKGIRSDIYGLLNCLDIDKREFEVLARYLNNNTEQNGILYSDMSNMPCFSESYTVTQLAEKFNNHLYRGFKPYAQIEVYDKYMYNHGHEFCLNKIMIELKQLSNKCVPYEKYFSEENVNALELLSKYGDRLDDPLKKDILGHMFRGSQIHLIYGSAGTGKTTLVNHIARLMDGMKKIFLAKTNPAVENLRHKISKHEDSDEFITIDRFVKNSRYDLKEYDLIVVDECSTVKNEEIVKIIAMLGNGLLVLAGDIYQIQAIGFGNWFKFAKNILSADCCSELTTPFRSTDKNLKEFWDEVRNMNGNDLVLEKMVSEEYSSPIDNTIFDKKSNDEIILCLNYSGLYGLNNINKLLQLGNPNPAVNIGIWQFKVGDPILFNDSERFSVLYNNLKGHIVKLGDERSHINCEIEVDLVITKKEVDNCLGLKYIEGDSDKTVVGFSIARTKPYSSDDDIIENKHILPFQIAYAVSIHKSQGLEYDSVKIVIADDSEEKITHSVFYTAITRAKHHLKIFWSPEVCNRVIRQLSLQSNNDYVIFKNRYLLK